MGIRVASAPVSWGIMKNVEFPADYPCARVLDEIARAGYSGSPSGAFLLSTTNVADTESVIRKLDSMHHPVIGRKTSTSRRGR